MRPALPNLFKAEANQQRGHFTGFQDGQRAHGYATWIV